MGCSSGRTPRPDTGVITPIDTGVRADTPIPVFTDAPIVPVDTGRDAPIPVTPDAPTTRMCVPSCTMDSQCASSCPANPRGANCCDTLAGVCYAAMVAVCPVTTPEDGGTSMY